MNKSNIFLIIAGISIILIGIFDSISAVTIYNTGNAIQSGKAILADVNEIIIASSAMFFISILLIISGIGVIRGKKTFIHFSVSVLIMYILSSILTEYLLYKEPLGVGSSISFILATLILGLLYLGRRSNVLNHPTNENIRR